MPANQFFTRLLKDPPPGFVFEISEAGIAAARASRPPQLSFHPIEPDVIAVSPVKDNVARPDALAAHVRRLAPPDQKQKRLRAVLIVPDCAVRVSVLDFDSFPADAEEQMSLVRFRIKKTLPFDIESAAVSYFPQPVANGSKKRDVVVAAAPLEIVARYEAPFRSAGFQTGHVTTSTLACLEMVRYDGMALLAKLSGRFMTISVLQKGGLKLLRCIEVSENGAGQGAGCGPGGPPHNPAEVLGHLFQTFAYTEDQLGAKPGVVLLCGFGSKSEEMRQTFEYELDVPVELLRSRFGSPAEENAGAMGYLETMEEL